MANIGPLEIAIVLIIALVVLGPKRLPEMGKSVGRGMREFKHAVTGHDNEPEPTQLVAVAEAPAPVVAAEPRKTTIA
jgi:sec-independent protein translocase protein TatA